MPYNNIFSSAEKVFNMKERYIRIILIYFILLLVDLVKPFGYSLNVEFLFLGIVSVFLIYPYFPALAWGGIFGYFKDAVSGGGVPLNLIEFFCLFMVIRFALHKLNRKFAKVLLISVILIVHIIMHSLYVDMFSFGGALIFFIQSIVIFFPLNYLLRKWMKISPVGYI
ncbi:MAG: hypothetical protein GY858_07470 [Candidatus Omnitrophica bacterium]|nr:hypothetical protein [Candidatus Omnitrophota bacterium]